MERHELVEKLRQCREKNLRLTQALSAVYDVAASTETSDETKVDDVLEIARRVIGDRS